MSQKYVIVHFINKATTPEEFAASEWPLHVTLLSNFRIPSLEKLENELATYAQQSKPFDIAANGTAQFGPNKNIAVSLVRPDENILEIHNELLALATKLGAVFDEPAFIGTGFRPHATKQVYASLQDEDVVNLGDFTLVDMFPNNDISRRKIIKTFTLTG